LLKETIVDFDGVRVQARLVYTECESTAITITQHSPTKTIWTN